MNRALFIRSLMAFPIAASMTRLNELHKITGPLTATEKLPAFFLGHGSPMNAIEDNEFSRQWKNAVSELQKPKAVICISAHWETKGTFVTAMEHPRTIHDFGGFPQELFDVQYPAPGSESIAVQTKDTIHKSTVGLDQEWGLDHGCWSVLKHMFPDADVPVIQLSLDYTKDAQWHFDLAKELNSLRSKGILIVGSGNMVHNLGILNWHHPEIGYEWAIEANEKMKTLMLSGDFEKLIHYENMGKAFELSIPTPEHYLPLLYTLALKSDKEQITIFNDKTIMGSISMTSIKIS